MSEHGIPYLVEKGWTRAVDIESTRTLRALFYPDGSIGLEHECTRPRDGLTIVCAPKLQLDGGHTIVQRDPLTVSPSCGCYDCGLHGFIRNGCWVDA